MPSTCFEPEGSSWRWTLAFETCRRHQN